VWHWGAEGSADCLLKFGGAKKICLLSPVDGAPNHSGHFSPTAHLPSEKLTMPRNPHRNPQHQRRDLTRGGGGGGKDLDSRTAHSPKKAQTANRRPPGTHPSSQVHASIPARFGASWRPAQVPPSFWLLPSALFRSRNAHAAPTVPRTATALVRPAEEGGRQVAPQPPFQFRDETRCSTSPDFRYLPTYLLGHSSLGASVHRYRVAPNDFARKHSVAFQIRSIPMHIGEVVFCT